jgi:protein-S-isoprenylcysteine O-methyltransferase Ste14
MTGPAAHQSQWEISEVVFGIPLLTSIVMHLVVPLPFAHATLRLVFIPLGIILVAVGVTFIVLARRELAEHGQPAEPGRPTSRIVSSGVFSISRNPLYLGIVIMVIGIALAFNVLWVIILLLPAVVLCHYVLIFPEERYLSARLGEEYKAYTLSVYRWLGRKRIAQ